MIVRFRIKKTMVGFRKCSDGHDGLVVGIKHQNVNILFSVKQSAASQRSRAIISETVKPFLLFGIFWRKINRKIDWVKKMKEVDFSSEPPLLNNEQILLTATDATSCAWPPGFPKNPIFSPPVFFSY